MGRSDVLVNGAPIRQFHALGVAMRDTSKLGPGPVPSSKNLMSCAASSVNGLVVREPYPRESASDRSKRTVPTSWSSLAAWALAARRPVLVALLGAVGFLAVDGMTPSQAHPKEDTVCLALVAQERDGTLKRSRAVPSLPQVPDEARRLAQALPELVMVPPADLAIQVETTSDGKRVRRLRTTSAVQNEGTSPFHLRIARDPQTGAHTACQQIYQAIRGANGERLGYLLVDSVPVGAFDFDSHPHHNHLHHRLFARLSLLTTSFEPAPGASAPKKLGFCLSDVARSATLELDGSPKVGAFPWMCRGMDAEQGISIGWVDRYAADLSGQSIDVTEVPDGLYYVVAAANTDFVEKKKDKRNNFAATMIEISGNRVGVLKQFTGEQFFAQMGVSTVATMMDRLRPVDERDEPTLRAQIVALSGGALSGESAVFLFGALADAHAVADDFKDALHRFEATVAQFRIQPTLLDVVNRVHSLVREQSRAWTIPEESVEGQIRTCVGDALALAMQDPETASEKLRAVESLMLEGKQLYGATAIVFGRMKFKMWNVTLSGLASRLWSVTRDVFEPPAR